VFKVPLPSAPLITPPSNWLSLPLSTYPNNHRYIQDYLKESRKTGLFWDSSISYNTVFKVCHFVCSLVYELNLFLQRTLFVLFQPTCPHIASPTTLTPFRQPLNLHVSGCGPR
jgi:hypothetical protein